MRAIVIVLAALAIGTATLGGLKWRSARQAGISLAQVESRRQALQKKITILETQLAATEQRVVAVENDNALLEATMTKAEAAKSAPSLPVSRQAVEDRFKLARELAMNGDPETALRELLWCYDEGFSRLNSNSRSQQLFSVVSEISSLAGRYPPALVALRERADQLRAVLLSPSGDSQHISELASLLRTLKDDTTLLALYDHFPPGDRRRQTLAIYASDQLLAAQRYSEIASRKTYAGMLASFESAISTGSAPLKSYTIRSAAKDIEVLAGVGKLEEAREYSERVLQYDPVPETRALLQSHLERAGRPELLKQLQK